MWALSAHCGCGVSEATRACRLWHQPDCPYRLGVRGPACGTREGQPQQARPVSSAWRSPRLLRGELEGTHNQHCSLLEAHILTNHITRGHITRVGGGTMYTSASLAAPRLPEVSNIRSGASSPSTMQACVLYECTSRPHIRWHARPRGCSEPHGEPRLALAFCGLREHRCEGIGTGMRRGDAFLTLLFSPSTFIQGQSSGAHATDARWTFHKCRVATSRIAIDERPSVDSHKKLRNSTPVGSSRAISSVRRPCWCCALLCSPRTSRSHNGRRR